MVFGQAYQRVQRQSFAKSGKIGPLNIYAPRMGGLLALWACVKDSVLSTGMLLKKAALQKLFFVSQTWCRWFRATSGVPAVWPMWIACFTGFACPDEP